MITVLVVILFLGIGVIISFVCEDISPILIVGVLSSVYGCSDIGVKKETPKSSVEKSIIKEASFLVGEEVCSVNTCSENSGIISEIECDEKACVYLIISNGKQIGPAYEDEKIEKQTFSPNRKNPYERK